MRKELFIDLLAVCALFFILFLAPGCSTGKPVVQTVTIEKETIIHHRDTTIVTAPDSASVLALLECDSNYNVVIDKLSTIIGERITPSVKTEKVSESSNITALTFTCREDSLMQVIDLLEREIRDRKVETVIKEVEKKGFFYRSGVAFWVILALVYTAGLIITLLRYFKK